MIDDKTLPAPRPDEVQVIQSYGPGKFRISNVVYDHPVLVLPLRTQRWIVDPVAEFEIVSLAPLREGDGTVDILLVGCGAQARAIPSKVRAWLREAGIVADAMDTGAACRTYGVLLAEGRRVGAALLPIS